MVGHRPRSAGSERTVLVTLFVILLLGCSSGSPLQPETGRQPVDTEIVVLSPAEAVVQATATVRFSASVDDSSQGSSLLWSATGGTISDDGAYTAGTDPGLYRVIAATAGGAADTASVTVEPRLQTSLIVQPSRASLVPAGTQQFVVDVRYSDGSAADGDVSWQAQGGQISTNGVFTAGDDYGVFEVVGRGPNGLADTAVVVIDSVPPPVPATLVIDPEAVTLSPGDSQRFAADLRDEDATAIAGAVVWRATGGTIDSEGNYTAAETPGDYTAFVESTNGLVDSATITILPPPNESPNASFVYTCVDLSCDFDGSASTDAEGTIVSYAWSFADGTTADGIQVAHTYSESGNFIVVLTVTDDAGETDTDSQLVGVQIDQPDTWINPGDDIQAAVDAHPAGTSFLIKAGTHRLQSIKPQHGNEFTGEPGAILSGARLLTEFVREAGFWSVSEQTQEGQVQGLCSSDFNDASGDRYTGCRYPEDLFFDDEPLRQVTSMSQVAPGTWYFDYAANKVFFHDDPTNRKVEISVATSAFLPTADNVTIRGLTIEKYANPAQQGAVQAGSHSTESLTHGWVIEDNEIRLNHGVGVRLGHGTQVVRNIIHHNGQLGVGGVGDNIRVEDNEISFNNTLFFSSGWEAGGTKFVKTRGLLVRGNRVHHNNGPGLWTDIDNIDTTYEDNEVYNNTSAGIFHEISYAAIIRNNTVTNNGHETGAWLYGAGILVAHSPDVEVYGNTVVNNFNGIAGIQQERGSGEFGPHRLENLWVHDNNVTMMDGRTGIAHDTGEAEVFTGRNNRFDYNTYSLGPNTKYFHWQNPWSDENQWKDAGQDLNGVFQP